MPMLHARRKPDDIAGMDLLNRATLALRPTTTGGDNQGLAERVGMPRGASARLEGYACARCAGGCVWLEQGIDAHRADKPILRSFDRWL